MGKCIPFHSTHQILPSNQISANKQIHTHKKSHNKLALVLGVKHGTRRWTQQCGKIWWEKERASKWGRHGTGELSIPMGEKGLQRRAWCSSWGQNSPLDESSEDCSVHPMNEDMTWQSARESWWQQSTWLKTINITPQNHRLLLIKVIWKLHLIYLPDICIALQVNCSLVLFSLWQPPFNLGQNLVYPFCKVQTLPFSRPGDINYLVNITVSHARRMTGRSILYLRVVGWAVWMDIGQAEHAFLPLESPEPLTWLSPLHPGFLHSPYSAMLALVFPSLFVATQV